MEGPMYRNVGLIVLFSLLALLLGVSPAQASGATCSANPPSGPPGTAFSITCSGYSSNAIVNTYLIEPGGRAVSGAQITGFVSALGNGAVVTDKNGTASFTWQSADGALGFANQFGSWTWVVHQFAPGGAVAAEGQMTVHLTNDYEIHPRAVLAVKPVGGTTFNFVGTGFVPFEGVNTRVTPPPNCSGRDSAGASAVGPLGQGSFAGYSGPSSVKADESGNIAFSLVFTSQACRGSYTVAARALRSGIGGEVTFRVRNTAITTDMLLAATPDSVTAIAPFLTLLGNGFPASAVVSCWTTRPDGHIVPVGNASADSSGNFALSIHASGFDSLWPLASEEPGIWYATCGRPNGSVLATTSFMVTGLTSDP
jgi:hypothetical protein